MKSLFCDICKKEIASPISGRNYFHIREFDICEPCKDSIDARLRPIVRGHDPYSAEWFEHQIVSLISKGVQTHRV